MAALKSAFLFLVQSVVVGLAVAFLVLLLRPDLLPFAQRVPATQVASYADAVDRSSASVANVYTERLVEDGATEDERPRFRVSTSFASAVVIDANGLLVTNYHVVAAAAGLRVQLSDGRIAEPEVVGVDEETDLALLRVDFDGLPAIDMGSSSDIRIGDVVLAIGNPYGLSKSVTQGIVSATGRGLLNLTTFENYIQTDAAINAGNSGGALINTAGELIGINTAVLAQDAGTEGIGFAIPVDLVRGVINEIRENGRVIRGWLGLEPDDLTGAERDLLGIESDRGILVYEIYEGGPAAAANLRPGDVILAINGEAIRSKRQAQLLVAGTQPGDTVDIVIYRDGQEYRASVEAGERPKPDVLE